jgi:tetratricopeptide (TPR) repeat protein
VAQTAKAKLTDVSLTEASNIENFNDLVNIRVSPNSYFVTFFLAGFLTGFLIYLDYQAMAFVMLAVSWILIPFFAWKDRIVFDGKHVFRTGILPNIWAAANGKPRRLKISQIEQIETQALRALKRGGNVFYRYRTSVNGKGLRLAFASGGEEYRQMINLLFGQVTDDVLDNRSLELRDYLKDGKETLMKAEFARIPSMEVLESSVNEFQSPDKSLRSPVRRGESSPGEGEKAVYLRQLANELRMSGNLLQALETFRRTLLLDPNNAWLIFEFARCLHSYASLERSKRLLRKANAALRLAEMKAGRDAELLARIGESHFQYGNWKRAQRTFYRTLSVSGNSFRSVRGLAEVALREGKIAHVIHHFASASHFAENSALKRWADGENEYFTKLNSDDTYMEAEMTRISWLENIERKKRIMMRISFLSLLIVFTGVIFNETVANIGWVASFISIMLWIGLMMSQGLLSERCPIIDSDD